MSRSEYESSHGAISLGQLQQLQLEAECQLLGLLFLARSIGMIFGLRGSGKSLVAILIGYAIAGMKCLPPWGTGNGAVVCYLDGEMRIRGLRERLDQLHAFNTNEESRSRVEKSFFIISRDHTGDVIGSIDTEEGQDAIDAALPDHVDLIIIDNLSAWTSAGAEDVKSWQSVKSWLIKKRLRGIAVLLLHHAGKGGAQRGTSAHEDLLDYSIQVTPHEAEEVGQTAFTVEHTKLRDHLPELKTKQLFTVWTEGGAMRFKVEPQLSHGQKMLAKILELKRKNPAMTQRVIASELGINAAQVSRYLKRRGDSPASDTGDE
jgi:putative DNA primase/helicase